MNDKAHFKRTAIYDVAARNVRFAYSLSVCLRCVHRAALCPGFLQMLHRYCFLFVGTSSFKCDANIAVICALLVSAAGASVAFTGRVRATRWLA